MKLTIITINLNNSIGLKKTIESVERQLTNNIEFIVIDGDSSDDSKDIIEHHAKNIHKILIEKDKGPYDAMNKGIKMASGEYLLFLNSGDVLFKNNLKNCITQLTDFDLFFFDVEVIGKNGKYIQQISDPSFHFLTEGHIIHQGVVFKKTLFEKIGLYDLQFFIASDYDFLLKSIFKFKCSCHIIHQTLTTYDDVEGISSISENQKKLKAERYKALSNTFPLPIIEVLKEKDALIDDLFMYKYKYEGLLNSKSIKLLISLINIFKSKKKG